MRAFMVLVVAFIIAGCAAEGGGDHGYVEKTYRTGSNISVSRTHAGDDARAASQEDVENARNGSLNPGRQVPTPSSR